MGTEGAVSKEFGHSPAPSCSPCSGPAACQTHWGYGVTSREGKRGRVGSPQLQGVVAAGAVAENSVERQKYQRKPQGKSWHPWVYYFASLQLFLSLCKCVDDRNLLQSRAGTVNSTAGLKQGPETQKRNSSETHWKQRLLQHLQFQSWHCMTLHQSTSSMVSTQRLNCIWSVISVLVISTAIHVQSRNLWTSSFFTIP